MEIEFKFSAGEEVELIESRKINGSSMEVISGGSIGTISHRLPLNPKYDYYVHFERGGILVAEAELK